MPNLIIRFGTCNVRRLNQLGWADWYLGRPAVLFGRACRIQRQRDRLCFIRRTFSCAETNAYITNTLNKLVLTQSSAHTTCFDRQEDLEDLCSLFFKSTKIILA